MGQYVVFNSISTRTVHPHSHEWVALFKRRTIIMISVERDLDVLLSHSRPFSSEYEIETWMPYAPGDQVLTLEEAYEVAGMVEL